MGSDVVGGMEGGRDRRGKKENVVRGDVDVILGETMTLGVDVGEDGTLRLLTAVEEEEVEEDEDDEDADVDEDAFVGDEFFFRIWLSFSPFHLLTFLSLAFSLSLFLFLSLSFSRRESAIMRSIYLL